MASTSASSQPSTSSDSDSELSRLSGIEALKLTAGPARRNLFGPVDHQQLRRDFERLLCVGAEAAAKRWNFDFQRDAPGKDGSGIEWVGVQCQDVPAFYRSRTVTRPPAKAARRASTSSGERSPMSSSSCSSGEEYLEVTTRGSYRITGLGKRRQPAITDFFKVKKRKLLQRKATPLQ